MNSTEELPIEPDDPQGVASAPTEKPRTIQDVEDIMKVLEETEAASQRELRLPFPPEPTKRPVVEDFPTETQDPVRSRKLYYPRLERLRKQALKGLPRKVVRMVRDEIGLFINQGETSGRDQRQGYFYHLEVAIATIENWFAEGHGANIGALFKAFRDLNLEREAKLRSPKTTGDDPAAP